MKKLKAVLVILVLAVVGYVGFLMKDNIFDSFINTKIYNKDSKIYSANKYYRALSVSYVSDTENYVPKNKQDLLDIIYTVLNSGLTEFKFYCSDEYTECIDDVGEIIDDDTILTNLNNFVHPYNSYNKMYVTVNSLGEININIEHLYSEKDIEVIEEYVNKVIDEELNSSMTTEQKIKAIHDYIINNTKYDSSRSKNTNSKNNISHKANGLFTTGYAICSGYADTMAIFLNKLGVINYKISSEEHVWNYVYLDGKWLHLDLTWDDPVTNTGQDIITYDYFLIDGDTLASKKSDKHIYDKNVFKEK